MNIYKVSQTGNDDYDTFDSMIVIAESEEDARWMRPDEDSWDNFFCVQRIWLIDDWYWPEECTVELIGEALPGMKPGVVLASFNAG